MLNPTFIGLFANSKDVFEWAKEYGKTGLYYAETGDIYPMDKPNEVYFWLKESVPDFGIWIFPRKNLRMVSLSPIYINPNFPHDKIQLLHTSIDEFCSHTINISHPATEWLLFNQELWNPRV